MLSSIITILLIIILSPVILIAGLISLFFIFGLILFLIGTIGLVIIAVQDFIDDIVRKVKKQLKAIKRTDK